MNYEKRLEKLEDIVKSMPIIDPILEECCRLSNEGISKLTEEEKKPLRRSLKNWKNNGSTWVGIELDEKEYYNVIKLGLSKLDSDEYKPLRLLLEKKRQKKLKSNS